MQFDFNQIRLRFVVVVAAPNSQGRPSDRKWDTKRTDILSPTPHYATPQQHEQDEQRKQDDQRSEHSQLANWITAFDRKVNAIPNHHFDHSCSSIFFFLTISLPFSCLSVSIFICFFFSFSGAPALLLPDIFFFLTLFCFQLVCFDWIQLSFRSLPLFVDAFLYFTDSNLFDFAFDCNKIKSTHQINTKHDALFLGTTFPVDDSLKLLTSCRPISYLHLTSESFFFLNLPFRSLCQWFRCPVHPAFAILNWQLLQLTRILDQHPIITFFKLWPIFISKLDHIFCFVRFSLFATFCLFVPRLFFSLFPPDSSKPMLFSYAVKRIIGRWYHIRLNPSVFTRRSHQPLRSNQFSSTDERSRCREAQKESVNKRFEYSVLFASSPLTTRFDVIHLRKRAMLEYEWRWFVRFWSRFLISLVHFG